MPKLWPLGLYRVYGDSMLPTYRPGDLLIGWRWFRPQPNQVVVASTDRHIIKRITKIQADQIFLAGDNRSASTDSTVDKSQLLALVIAKLR